MRAVVLALAVMFASVSAWPQNNYGVVKSESRHFIVGIIITLIEEYSRLVRDRGLDPYSLDHIEGSYALPVPGLFSASGSVTDVALEGISEVAIHELGFDDQSDTISFSLSYPRVYGSVGDASGKVNILDYQLDGAGYGSIYIEELGFTGTVKLSLSLESGINIERLDVAISLVSIKSDINLVLLGNDVSDAVNNFINETLPQFVGTYQEEISTVIDYVVRHFVNHLL